MPLLAVVMLPMSIVRRYRAGTARRLAKPWLATTNALMMGLSVALFIIAAVAMSVWVPKVILYALAGIAVGSLLGLLGLKLTRWELSAQTLHYTPNRALVLLLTVIVAARIAYGFWRMWNAWQHSAAPGSWLANAYLPGSVGVGAVVLGYYLIYWAGVSLRVERHRAANKWI